jgi:putative tryptophan/tyrosine transport system substrate-binding protein
MLNRRAFLFGTISAALAIPLAAQAQQAGKVVKIGYVNPGPPRARTSRAWDALLQGLREHGLVEGRNLVMESRYASGQGDDRVRALLTELVATRPDVIVTVTTSVARVARDTVQNIPVIMAVSTDPLGGGVVESLARPGGNVTGFALTGPELTPKRLELLKTAAPRVSRAVVVVPSQEPVYALYMKEARAAGPELGLTEVELVNIGTDPARWERALEAVARAPGTGLLITEYPSFVRHAGTLSALVQRHGVPAIYGLREHVEQGGLMSYGADVADLFHRVGAVVHQVLNGVDPGTIPVEQPRKYDFFVNLKTARALDLTIPLSLLLQADQVIE